MIGGKMLIVLVRKCKWIEFLIFWNFLGFSWGREKFSDVWVFRRGREGMKLFDSLEGIL